LTLKRLFGPKTLFLAKNRLGPVGLFLTLVQIKQSNRKVTTPAMMGTPVGYGSPYQQPWNGGQHPLMGSPQNSPVAGYSSPYQHPWSGGGQYPSKASPVKSPITKLSSYSPGAVAGKKAVPRHVVPLSSVMASPQGPGFVPISGTEKPVTGDINKIKPASVHTTLSSQGRTSSASATIQVNMLAPEPRRHSVSGNVYAWGQTIKPERQIQAERTRQAVQRLLPMPLGGVQRFDNFSEPSTHRLQVQENLGGEVVKQNILQEQHQQHQIWSGHQDKLNEPVPLEPAVLPTAKTKQTLLDFFWQRLVPADTECPSSKDDRTSQAPPADKTSPAPSVPNTPCTEASEPTLLFKYLHLPFSPFSFSLVGDCFTFMYHKGHSLL